MIAPLLALLVAQSGAAEILVERAVAAYKEGSFAKAGAFFLEAYELSSEPAQLRNAAKAYQRAEEDQRAEALWLRFLELAEIPPTERAEAEAQIELLRERRRAASAEAEARRAREDAERARVPPEMAAGTEAPSVRLPVGPIVTLAFAVGIGIAAGSVYWHSDRRLDQLDEQLELLDDDDLIVGIHRTEAEETLDSVNRERLIAAILGGIAGAAAIAGSVWWLLDLGSVQPLAGVAASGVTVGFAGSW